MAETETRTPGGTKPPRGWDEALAHREGNGNDREQEETQATPKTREGTKKTHPAPRWHWEKTRGNHYNAVQNPAPDTPPTTPRKTRDADTATGNGSLENGAAGHGKG